MRRVRSVLTIETCKAVAEARGGECLSETFTRSIDKLRWRCALGHEWETSLNQVKDGGHWCAICMARKRGAASLEDLQAFAESKGGKCLAEVYKKSNIKVSWQCAAGHRFDMKWHAVKIQGHWCPECAWSRRRLTLGAVQQTAVARGGELLSTEYKNNIEPLDWRCSEGHTWRTSYSNILQGKWCPQCACDRLGRRLQVTIDDMRALAEERGGTCLSDVYTNMTAHLRWRCGKGHEWDANPNNVQNNGTWCPNCLYKGEDETRDIFERLTGHKFPNRTGVLSKARYQLDGYCAELRIAFEYHGGQHYKYVPYFHRNGVEDFEHQQEIDAEKEALCFDEQIVLITIPHYCRDKEQYIRKMLYGLF